MQIRTSRWLKKSNKMCVGSSVTQASHSVKCLTPAAALIRCSACCCCCCGGGLPRFGLLGRAGEKIKKEKVLYRASAASNMLTCHHLAVCLQKDKKQAKILLFCFLELIFSLFSSCLFSF